MKRFASMVLVVVALLLFTLPVLAEEGNTPEKAYEAAFNKVMEFAVSVEGRNNYLVNALDGAEKVLLDKDAASKMMKVQAKFRELGILIAEKKADLGECSNFSPEKGEKVISIIEELQKLYKVQETLREIAYQILTDEKKRIEKEHAGKLLA